MKLAQKLAAALSQALGYDAEKQSVIAYGLGALLQLLTLLAIAAVFGLFFDCFTECMLVFWGVGLLRRTTGGTHCSTYGACILTSSLSVCLMALLCRYAVPARGYAAAFLLPAVVCFAAIAYRRVPQGSPNKPITNPAKRKRLRRRCALTCALYVTAAVFLFLFGQHPSRSVSAVTAVFLWQSFTLTPAASRLAAFMDALFPQHHL